MVTLGIFVYMKTRPVMLIFTILNVFFIIDNRLGIRMKLTDVNMFLNSLKSGWVERLLNTESNGCWQIVYNHILNRN